MIMFRGVLAAFSFEWIIRSTSIYCICVKVNTRIVTHDGKNSAMKRAT